MLVFCQVNLGLTTRVGLDQHLRHIKIPDFNLDCRILFHSSTIQDENDNTPHFSQSVYTGTAVESNSINIFVIQLIASDKDSGVNGALAYAITAGNIDGTFSIQSDGKLYTKQTLDRELSLIHI